MAAEMERGYWTDIILKAVEPIIFGKKLTTLAVLILLTIVFAWQAANIKPDAGWLKSVPLSHPYMETFERYYKDFGGANTVLLALIQEEGDIYNERFMTDLQNATDDIFFLPGVDRARVMSMFTPNVTYVEVIEGGLSGATVIPPDYKPTPEILEKIKSNVGKAQIIGRLVTEDQRGAMVVSELLEFDPTTGEKLDYRKVGEYLEEIRAKYEKDGITVHIIGFAKIVDDMTDASMQVVGFFMLALLLTGVLLWIYTGSFKLAMLPLGCSIVAVIWEIGLLKTVGFGLDPFAILVPFLVLSVSVSHGVQYANAWVGEVDRGASPYDASLETFRRLAIPGTAALITDVAGFATIYLIDIDIIREMSVNAAFGIAAIIITNKMLMPIWLTMIEIKDLDAFRVKQLRRENLGDGLWKLIAKNTRPAPAAITLIICAVLLGWSIWKKPELKIGDAMEGVPELRPDSRFNQDFRKIVGNFEIGVDIFKVVAETKPDACVDYELLEQMDNFSWHMENTPGVQSTLSLLTFATLVYQGLAEGRLNALVLPRNKFALAQSTALVPTSTGMLNTNCDAVALWMFTEDHKAETIANLVREVKAFDKANREKFYAEHPGVNPDYCDEKYWTLRKFKEKDDAITAMSNDPDASQEALLALKSERDELETKYATFDQNCPVRFSLATGNVGVMAATNEVVEKEELQIVAWVYVVVVLFLWLSFRSIPGVLCVVLPLSLVSVMAYGVMAMLDIGLKVATLPVVALAVGIGVDYGIYVFSELLGGLKKGQDMETAFYHTLHSTGKAVIFTGIALGGSVSTWLLSALQFQIDMGIMLVFMFTANMFGAILVLPALAHFLVDPEKVHAKAMAQAAAKD